MVGSEAKRACRPVLHFTPPQQHTGLPDRRHPIDPLPTLHAVRRRPTTGFDFVEVNPPLDVGTGVTSYLGALTVGMFLGYIDDAKSAS